MSWRIRDVAERMVSIAVLPGDTRDVREWKRLIVAVFWLTLIPSLSTAAMMQFGFRAPGAALVMVSVAIITVAVLASIRSDPSRFPGAFQVVFAVNVLASSSYVVLFGGLAESGVNSIWGLLTVLGALVVLGERLATYWLGAFAAATLLSSYLASRIEPLYSIPDPEFRSIFNLLTVGVIIYLVLRYYIRQRELFRERSERLLRNILPDEIADRLRSSDGMIAERYQSVSVLFADVAGFTPLSAGLGPDELVGVLDDVFSAFDALVDERGLEKIKTIGDAYMVAAGVPMPRNDHAHAICDLALAMNALVASRTFGGRRLTFRIGIDSGPVVAGIIGRRKFSYDLWGDTVNTASRMESHGIPGGIQLTDATRHLVADAYECEPRGEIEVKGKGTMRVWLLVGPRDPGAADWYDASGRRPGRGVVTRTEEDP